MCVGGVDLNPIVYSCSYSGMIFGVLSVKNLLYILVVGGLLYFGWPYFEAVLIALPIPDPKELKEKFSGMFSKGKGASANKKPANAKAAGYTERFDQAPESLEEDDDDEDVGKPMNLNKGGNFNYDSDEDKDGGNELISLDSSSRDRTNTAAEKIPNLQKPK